MLLSTRLATELDFLSKLGVLGVGADGGNRTMEETVEYKNAPNVRWTASWQPEAETTVEFKDLGPWHSNSLMQFVKSGIDR